MVRCILPDGSMGGVLPIREAQELANQNQLDLVEVSPNAEPPVCRIMDFGKYRYEESIRRKESRKHQHRQQTKELKFHANVEDHDIQTKLKKLREFIDKGDKVKLTLRYRGRENAHRELGFEVLQRVIAACEDVAVVEQPPRMLGRMLGCMVAPKPATKTVGKKA